MGDGGKGSDPRPLNVPGRSISRKELDEKFDKLDWNNYKKVVTDNRKLNKRLDEND